MNDGFIGQQKPDDKSNEEESTEYVFILGFVVWSGEVVRVGEVLSWYKYYISIFKMKSYLKNCTFKV